MKVEYFVQIKQGNLVLEENADFIVNASNTSLILGSGVSMAFFRHCGKELQLQMNDALSEIHTTGYQLKKGDAIPTRSGNANNFKHALHVVTVDNHRGVHFKKTRPVLADIDRALESIEKVIVEYAKLHNKKKVSLVLPLLGCGVGGLNKVDITKKYKQFFKAKYVDKNMICQVIVYGYSPDDMNLLNKLR